MADYTSTNTTSLPSWLQPQAAGYINRAQQVSDSPYQAYTGDRVAGMTPWQDQGYAAQAQRAMSGNSTMNAANQALPKMFDGGVGATRNAYAGANPYLQQNIDAATGDVTRAWNNVQKPAWDTAMSRSGSFGNSGVMQANQNAQSDMQRNLGNMASGMRMQDYTQQQQLGEQFAGRNDSMYSQGQNRALSALGMAPSYAANDYMDIQALQGAGAPYQAMNQQGLNNAYQQFTDQQNYGAKQLDIFGNALGRVNLGSQSSQTQPGASTGAQLAGGAVTGAALYNMLFGKP